jgi:hypothetical protein
MQRQQQGMQSWMRRQQQHQHQRHHTNFVGAMIACLPEVAATLHTTGWVQHVHRA